MRGRRIISEHQFPGRIETQPSSYEIWPLFLRILLSLAQYESGHGWIPEVEGESIGPLKVTGNKGMRCIREWCLCTCEWSIHIWDHTPECLPIPDQANNIALDVEKVAHPVAQNITLIH